MNTFTSIPFKTNTSSGFTSVNGVAKFSPAGIVLEFESKLLGLISEGIKEARLAIEDILDVRFRKGFLRSGAKIEIRLRSLIGMEALPISDGKITLKIERIDHARAAAAVRDLSTAMAEYAASVPPPSPPAASLFGEGEADTNPLDPQVDPQDR